MGALVAAPLVLPHLSRAQDAPHAEALDGGPSAEVLDGGPYVPTPHAVVERMLDLAGVHDGDIVVDLGSGDGRLVIEAARRHGARGLGIERNGDLVRLARAAAAQAGVAERVSFRQGDIFEADLRRATVVTLYLLPRLLAQLGPKLRAELAPGARIVSHDYPLESWPADRMLDFDVPEKAAVMMSPRTQLFLYLVRSPV